MHTHTQIIDSIGLIILIYTYVCECTKRECECLEAGEGVLVHSLV